MGKKRTLAIVGGIVLAVLAMFAFIAKTPFIGAVFLICAVLLLRKPRQPMQKKETTITSEQSVLSKQPPTEALTNSHTYDQPRYKYIDYKLAGVTYKDGRLSRQAALRAIKFEEPPYYDHPELVAEIQEYDGNPSVAIKANGRMLGFIPKDKVSQFMADYPNYCGICDIKITGRKQDDGTWLNGATITVEVKNPNTEDKD